MFEHLRSNGIFVDGRERDSRHVVGSVAPRKFNTHLDFNFSTFKREDETKRRKWLFQSNIFDWNSTDDNNFEITYSPQQLDGLVTVDGMKKDSAL